MVWLGKTKKHMCSKSGHCDTTRYQDTRTPSRSERYGGFHKWGYPQIIQINEILHSKPYMSRYLRLWKPPYETNCHLPTNCSSFSMFLTKTMRWSRLRLKTTMISLILAARACKSAHKLPYTSLSLSAHLCWRYQITPTGRKVNQCQAMFLDGN